jgi:putative colanic acid biosynthesis acetyltransferase WcaF
MIDLKRSHLSFTNKLGRLVWQVFYLLAFRPTPIFLHSWRTFLLRVFGASLGSGVHVYPSAKIWAPWNLVMGSGSCLASNVDCYNVATVTLGEGATVSQYCYLCTASRDYRDPSLPLLTAPITLGAKAWVAADVYIGPGVIIGQGCVVAARTSLVNDVPAGFIIRQRFDLVAESIVRKLKRIDKSDI